MWPIYLVISELPFEERLNQENMILDTVWYEPSKSEFTFFSNTLHLSLEDLWSGVNCKLLNDQNINVRGFLLFGTQQICLLKLNV